MNFAGYDWILAHIDKEAQEAYFITKDIIAESTIFIDANLSLSGDDKRRIADDNSKLVEYCANMLKTIRKNYKNIPLKTVNTAFCRASGERQAGIFIPHIDDHIGTFDYFKTAANRVAKYNGVAADWWITWVRYSVSIYDDELVMTSYYMYYITAAGEVNSMGYYLGQTCTDVKGIRPMCCVALDGLPYILKNMRG